MTFKSSQSGPVVGGLRLARPLGGDVPCRRQRLRLPDGVHTPLLRHVPPATTGLPVLYVHGIQSHPGWYTHSAQALARAGHEVFQVTRRGSGDSHLRRGDSASAAQLLDDVAAAVDYVLEQTAAEGLAMLGVSWGGKLLVAYLLARPAGRVRSLTLLAPGIVPRVDVPAPTKLAIAACRLLRPKKYFNIPLSDVVLFTDNPAMQAYLRGDPHRLGRATVRLLFASAVLDRQIARARQAALTTPTTLILARRDRIIDNQATAALLDRLTGGSAQVVEFDAAHTIEFEPDMGEFLQTLCRAVEAGTDAAAP